MPTQDILLYETGNGGDIAIINNDMAMGELLFNQTYICLFGGNTEAETLGNEISGEIRNDWWANQLLFGNKKAKQFNSKTERALNDNALTGVGRVNIERAVEADLASLKAIADVAVSVSLPGNDRVQINIRLTQPSNQQAAVLQLIWDNSKSELIIERSI